MTLLVALKGADGLVLAADSRGTFGDPRGVTAQNDAQQKAHIVSQHAAVLIAGVGEVGSLIIRETQGEIKSQGIDGVTGVMNLLRNKVRTRYQEWFPSVAAIVPVAQAQSGQVATRPELAFVMAGYDLESTAPQPAIYQLASQFDFMPMLNNYGFAVAGVASYGLYLLNRLYQADRSVEELAALAVYAITETASQDGKVGGPVQVITIKPAEGAVALTQPDVQRIQEQNEQRSKALRDSFYQSQGDDQGGDH
jgi:20S proteasome alpha/beta subunit